MQTKNTSVYQNILQPSVGQTNGWGWRKNIRARNFHGLDAKGAAGQREQRKHTTSTPTSTVSLVSKLLLPVDACGALCCLHSPLLGGVLGPHAQRQPAEHAQNTDPLPPNNAVPENYDRNQDAVYRVHPRYCRAGRGPFFATSARKRDRAAQAAEKRGARYGGEHSV